MASIIDPDLAKSLIDEFQQRNSSSTGPHLTTPDGSFINGYFVDRESLESILSDPKVVGVSLQYAKHPDFTGKDDNIFTIILVGAVPNTDPGATSPYKSSGKQFDKLPPCPPNCTTWCN